jgi:hypothetical protein
MKASANPQHTSNPTASTAPAQPMRDGRNADSLRRRQRVITALERVAAEGGEISASRIARVAGVDRTFLYRHRDLLAEIQALQAEPAAADGTGPTVTRASLKADLLAAHERAVRLNTRIQQGSLAARASWPSFWRPASPWMRRCGARSATPTTPGVVISR